MVPFLWFELNFKRKSYFLFHGWFAFSTNFVQQNFNFVTDEHFFQQNAAQLLILNRKLFLVHGKSRGDYRRTSEAYFLQVISNINFSYSFESVG